MTHGGRRAARCSTLPFLGYLSYFAGLTGVNVKSAKSKLKSISDDTGAIFMRSMLPSGFSANVLSG